MSEHERETRKRSAGDLSDEDFCDSKRQKSSPTAKGDAAAKLRAIDQRKKALEAEKKRRDEEEEALKREEEALLHGTENTAGDEECTTDIIEYETRSEVDTDNEQTRDTNIEEDIPAAGGDENQEGWDVDIHTTEVDRDLSVSPTHSNHTSEPESDGEMEEDRKESHQSAHDEEKPSSSQDDHDHSPGEPVSMSVDTAEAMRPRLQKYLYREARYFMVKSNNHENVRLAKAKGVWSTPPQNEIKFNKAVAENTTVILIFSVKESGAFQGFARINGQSNKNGPRVSWVLPPNISARALSGVFKIDWISRLDNEFQNTMHLRNPWNMDKPVKIARDGQEIEPHVGAELCKLFTLDGSTDYERVISRIKRKRETLQKNKPAVPSYRSSANHTQISSRGGYRGRSGGSSSSYRSNGRDDRSSSRRDSGRSYGSSSRPGGYDANYRAGGVGADVIARGSYSDYLQEVARSATGYATAYDGGPPPPVIPGFGGPSRHDRYDHDRAVDDFLKRNSRSSGGSSSRYTDRRDRR